MPEETVRQYLFDRPGFYQIRIVGELDEHWLAHLEGLEISTNPWGKYQKVTQISGWLADQTALSGLLDLLSDLGRVILTVERIETDEEV
ncbi:MAG: hypothetical protein H6Q38_3352 [Chloroflexi bacterium]|nr:hypothetical protein [Chloroflexota bacterium]